MIEDTEHHPCNVGMVSRANTGSPDHPTSAVISRCKIDFLGWVMNLNSFAPLEGLYTRGFRSDGDPYDMILSLNQAIESRQSGSPICTHLLLCVQNDKLLNSVKDTCNTRLIDPTRDLHYLRSNISTGLRVSDIVELGCVCPCCSKQFSNQIRYVQDALRTRTYF